MLHKRVSESQVGSNGHVYLSVWFFFQIAAGHLALPILAATIIFAKSVRKRVQVANICATWIVASVCWSLLLYAGKYQGPDPDRKLCIAQASLAGAISVMTCSAALCLAHYLWRTYDDPDPPSDFATRSSKAATIWRVIIPYISFGVFVAIGVNLALKHPDRVNREQTFFYCSLNWSPLIYAINIVSVLICLAAIALEARIALYVAREWHLLRRGDHLTNHNIRFALRVFVFTGYLFVVSVLDLAAIWADLGVLPDMLHASLEMAVFVIFASQKDIIYAWCFWRYPPGERPSSLLTRRSRPLSPTQPLVPHLHAHGNASPGPHGDRSSKDTYASSRDYYELKAQGVEIIGRPDEAFRPAPNVKKPKPKKSQRDTISTWGF